MIENITFSGSKVEPIDKNNRSHLLLSLFRKWGTNLVFEKLGAQQKKS
jgi:hypothetical protein